MLVWADLEFAALDQLEGEDCSSLLSKGVTHWRHAARCDAAYILQTSNASMSHQNPSAMYDANWILQNSNASILKCSHTK